MEPQEWEVVGTTEVLNFGGIRWLAGFLPSTVDCLGSCRISKSKGSVFPQIRQTRSPMGGCEKKTWLKVYSIGFFFLSSSKYNILKLYFWERSKSKAILGAKILFFAGCMLQSKTVLIRCYGY